MRKLTWAALAAGTVLMASAGGGYAAMTQPALTAEVYHGCLSHGSITTVTLDGTPTCRQGSQLVNWRVQPDAADPSPGPDATTSAAVDTYYGCLSRGSITTVTLDGTPTCRQGSQPVKWRVRPDPVGPRPSPSLTPTATIAAPATTPASTPTSPASDPTGPTSDPTSTVPSSPSPAPSSPSPAPSSPSPSPTGTPCVTSAADGSCGAYLDPQIADSDGDNTYVTNDVWNPIPGWSQTLTAYGPDNWQAVVDMPAGNTAVVSYPDVQQLFGDAPLSSFASMTSSFTETMNSNSGTIGEAAWDIWCNNWNNEVMIWVDNYGQDLASSGDTYLGTTVIGGQTWDVYRNGPPGSELIVALDHNEQTGTVDILATLTYLQQQGWLPGGSTLTAVDFGAEFASTGGQDETFQVSQYTITAG